jgi:hypothetical protein
MRISLLGLLVSSLVGCATGEPDSSEALQQVATSHPATPIPTTTGSFGGSYVVPAPNTLSSAAVFAVPEIDWTVLNGVATLHYDLPVGLVGGDVSVSLTGTLATGASSLSLTTGSGTGSCSADGSIVTCSETFGDLGTMPVSTAAVQTAATQDGVSPSARVQVANLFGADPIGTVRFDMSKPTDDHGGGHGGGGGGHGGHGPH